MLGAALGLGLPEAYRFVAERGLRLGVGGWHEGEMRDLWRFQKSGDKEVKSDVLFRESWTDVRLALVVETPDARTAATIADAFRAPSYPLTAGPSDALLKVVAVRVDDAEPVATRILAHAVVFREIRPQYELYESLWTFLSIARSAPQPSNGFRPGSRSSRKGTGNSSGGTSCPSSPMRSSWPKTTNRSWAIA